MITREKLEHHISHLEEKLKVLRIDVKEAYMRGCDTKWETLKKQKLKLKDEIEEFRKKLEEFINNDKTR